MYIGRISKHHKEYYIYLGCITSILDTLPYDFTKEQIELINFAIKSYGVAHISRQLSTNNLVILRKILADDERWLSEEETNEVKCRFL